MKARMNVRQTCLEKPCQRPESLKAEQTDQERIAVLQAEVADLRRAIAHQQRSLHFWVEWLFNKMDEGPDEHGRYSDPQFPWTGDPEKDWLNDRQLGDPEQFEIDFGPAAAGTEEPEAQRC